MVRLKYTAHSSNTSSGTMSYTIERIGQPLLLGEGPHWDAESKKLYYVDILKSTIYCYDPEIKTVSKVVVGNGE